jgi:phage baseplate assembly protein W
MALALSYKEDGGSTTAVSASSGAKRTLQQVLKTPPGQGCYRPSTDSLVE